MVDDYPRYDVFMNNKAVTPQQKLSSTPVQFTVHIVNGSTSCDTDMKFVSLTLPENLRVPYPPNMPHLINGVYLETSNVNKTSFVVSLSKGCTYQQLPDDTGRTNVTRLYEICEVTPRDMIGDALICVWALNNYGVTSQPRCIDVIVAAWDYFAYRAAGIHRSRYPAAGIHRSRNPAAGIHRSRKTRCWYPPQPKNPLLVSTAAETMLQEPKTTIAMVAGITVGIIILLLLIAGLTWYLYKIHKESSQTGPAGQETWATKPGM
ncbi:unnamed protein product [Mytilus edulis]|uniref:Uncharacterized protein n=1 Tax=Mytilus edulis TaxID=6550 RepID=A0A8S3SB43_MYTED|nr:unnamed protein product [Mytilus edulis]